MKNKNSLKFEFENSSGTDNLLALYNVSKDGIFN